MVSQVYCMGTRKKGKHLNFEERYDHDYQKTPICYPMLDNDIDRNLLLNVTKKDLPRKGKSRKRKYRCVTRRIRDVEARRIDESALK